ncbi:MAG: thiol:disulfide interchange protein DsbG [Alphaproteobacteria bacterium]
MPSFRLPLLTVSILALIGLASPASAQNESNTNLPELPEPIQNLVNEGAQIRYLGRDYGVDGWLTVKNGQEQYFYVLPDQKAFLMGVMFDNTGQVVTVDQVQRLQKKGDDMLDMLADESMSMIEEKIDEQASQQTQFKSPSEQLYADIESSNWVPLGEAGAPIMYAFIDPQCPHCHSMIEDMKTSYLDTGRAQLRIVPIGFREETRAQSAFLLAAPDPQRRFYNFLEGDTDALPARAEINQQGVQRNLAIMQSWKFDVTPLVVYRAKDGTVKIVRGRPQDVPALISDLGSRV